MYNPNEVRRALTEKRSRSTPRRQDAMYKDFKRQFGIHLTNELDREVFIPGFKAVVIPILERYLSHDLQRVLEVGCGTGFFSRKLAPEWLADKLISFDISTASLQEMQKEDYPGRLLQASTYRLPFRKDSMDAVVGYSSFDTYLYLSDVVAQTRQVLKPGGKLVLFQDLYTEVYMLKGVTTKEECEASVERYHALLVDEVKRQGFTILAGEEEYGDAVVIGSISKLRRSIPDLELDEEAEPVLISWDLGVATPVRRASRERGGFTEEQVVKDITETTESLKKAGLLDRYNAKRGDVIETVRMRYLVAEKAA